MHDRVEAGVVQCVTATNCTRSPGNATGAAAAANPGPNGSDGPGVSAGAGLEVPHADAGFLPTGDDGGGVRFYTTGDVGLLRADGTTVWDREGSTFPKDWGLSAPTGATQKFDDPILNSAPSPLDPMQNYLGTPYAVGDLNGDGVPDVAVGQLFVAQDFVGTETLPYFPPASFVSVLDGRTGTTLWWHEFPGFVMQVRIGGGRVFVGDTTGPPRPGNSIGVYGTYSSLTAWTIHGHGDGPSAQSDWVYSPHSPWSLWEDLLPVGGGAIAAAWTDTPLGLADASGGRVVVLDSKTGHVRWAQPTQAYPRVLRYDQATRSLAVLAELDPSRSIGYQLLSLALGTGTQRVVLSRTGRLAFAFQVAATASRSSWIVTDEAVATCVVLGVSQPCLEDAAVTSVNPAGATLNWRTRTHAPITPGIGGSDPLGLVAVREHQSLVVVVASTEQSLQTPGTPLNGGYLDLPEWEQPTYSALQGFDGTSGARLWGHVTGDWSNPARLAVGRRGADPLLLSLDVEHDLRAYDPQTGRVASNAPTFAGSMYSALTVDVNRDGVPDLIVGGESGAVFALDGRHLNGKPRILWARAVSGEVHQLGLLHPASGPPIVAVAATSTFSTLDLSGQMLHATAFPGQFVWSFAVRNVDGVPLAVVPTDRLTAVNAVSGTLVWQYLPTTDGPTEFSDVAISAAGTVDAEYAVAPSLDHPYYEFPSDQHMIGIDQVTGRKRWDVPLALPQNGIAAPLIFGGVYASPHIPSAAGNGVTFTWDTGIWPAIKVGSYTTVTQVRDADTGRVDFRSRSASAAAQSDVAQTGAVPSQASNYVAAPRLGLAACGQGTGALITIDPGGGQQTVTGSCRSAIDVPVSRGNTLVLTDGSGSLFAVPDQQNPNAAALQAYRSPISMLSGQLVAARLGPRKQPAVIGVDYDYAAELDLQAPMNDYSFATPAISTPFGIANFTLTGSYREPATPSGARR